ncbi:DUF4013 domain-containing protein [Halosimplex salinum]|uniref:DUF4013 domain-containing protein n=1 Tax=Halosimplex salinum TaxID=1710538 RepID=UPI0013DE3811|nr:DUF4013 domain-containing protein [Halosimplex salinum]
MFTVLRDVLAGDRPVRTLAVGALLSSLGVFVLPAVFVAGFYGRVLARSAATGRDEVETPPVPTFAEWRTLATHGLKTWLVGYLYLCVGAALGVTIGVVAVAAGEVVGNGTGATVGALALIVLAATVLGVLSLPVWFFVPVALARLALTGRVGAALELRTVLRTAVTPTYLKRWVVGVCVLAVGFAVYLVLSFGGALPLVSEPLAGLPFVGHVVGAGVNFACQVVAFVVFGRGYAAAVAGSDHDPLLDDVRTEMGATDDGWGHDGRLPAWGELRDGDRGPTSVGD